MIARSRSPRGEAAVQRGDQLLEAPWVQMPDKTGRAVRHHRDRVLQPVPTQPRRAQEPEERPQRRRGQLHRSRPVTAESGHRRSQPRPRRGSPRHPPARRRRPPARTRPRTWRSYAVSPHTRRGRGADARRRPRARPPAVVESRVDAISCSLSSEPTGHKERRDYAQSRQPPPSLTPRHRAEPRSDCRTAHNREPEPNTYYVQLRITRTLRHGRAGSTWPR